MPLKGQTTSELHCVLFAEAFAFVCVVENSTRGFKESKTIDYCFFELKKTCIQDVIL